ncbi:MULTISPECIES: SAM hydrolase/SAM-dependent halogenase family protein [Halobacteriales]|uniref:S-adenosylmethionine hydroxide adenosyltransferase family protein n=2 Tax=Halobacteriales TaxID=2235 RepID=M1XU32_NATM8|nr:MULTISPECIES: SAM-dependent chlorinase/fluorinase [Halobacteria]RJX47279.1 S-adenosyl-l-methionine hydroxide adenosyltransferase [Halonotius pteroides]CCQ37966.1 S-adenosylmethionine hydroxide adenosyltransferase family protein [Natronomonas moolapensis 8.8.11]
MITLASDFGTPYPAAMKGAILGRCDARLVDVSHDFPRQNVRAAAFWLAKILPEFPPAVHLVVVDPGVGTDRAALVVRVGEHALVGPDNGVLLPPARALAETVPDAAAASGTPRDPPIDTYELDPDRPRSSTFHGRDVFAPGAAAVHEMGVERLGELDGLAPTDSVVDLEFPDPERINEGFLGEVLVVDGFGNVVTNVPGEVLGNRSVARIDGEPVQIVRSYAHAEAGEAVVIVGSHGNVECAVNRGRGDDRFGVEPGDALRIEFS